MVMIPIQKAVFQNGRLYGHQNLKTHEVMSSNISHCFLDHLKEQKCQGVNKLFKRNLVLTGVKKSKRSEIIL